MGAWIFEIMAVLRGQRTLMRVAGESMNPTLQVSDLLWIDRSLAGTMPRPGQIVVCEEPTKNSSTSSGNHPDSPHPRLVLVKRVLSCGAQAVYLGSDNPLEGRDSRHFGSVPIHLLRGQVIARWRGPWREQTRIWGCWCWLDER